jgi:hypothetical protein
MRGAGAADHGHQLSSPGLSLVSGHGVRQPGRAPQTPLHHDPARWPPRSRARYPARAFVQVVPTKAALRYWLTACSGTRNERPTRIASSSPECTKRYTVIFDTRMIKATSATVRNLTSLRGVSPAMQLPLPHEAEHLTGFSAPVTYASSVSPVRKRATLSKASLLLLLLQSPTTRTGHRRPARARRSGKQHICRRSVEICRRSVAALAKSASGPAARPFRDRPGISVTSVAAGRARGKWRGMC